MEAAGMGLGDRRARRREERETSGHGGNARRYRMRQKVLSIGDDYRIEDEDGERVFRVAPDQDPASLRAVTVAIDEMTHAGK
jgi:uncharacterized protein YxjI